ncbi:MAG: hypothetical protein JNM93_12020 [Bacteriovoracaceae bacterium]|nr:hypothetical protein [Bacteriovoracaceae bacterium]
MKSLRALFLALILTTTFSVQKSHALADWAITILGTTAATVISVIVNASVGSVDISANKKQEALLIKEVEDDAAVFVMNEGEVEPSALLATVMEEIRENEAVKKIDEEVTDLDIAKIVLKTAQGL